MSRTLVVRSLALAFVLTLTGSASARRPPALVAAEEQVERIFVTCPAGIAAAGYRDMLARFSHDPQQVPGLETGTGYVAAPQRMDDHVVLSCKGGRVHSGSGYRDMLWRFRTQVDEPQLAGTTRAFTALLVAR